jgi:hypothetical protein
MNQTPGPKSSRTATLSFFHGTSSRAAAKILNEGAQNIFDYLQVWDVASKVWSAILGHIESEWWKAATLFDQAGSPYAGVAPIALANAASINQQSLMTYGSFYVTLNFVNACGYALRSQTGSELLLMLSEGFRVLEHLGDPVAGQIREEYPHVSEVMRLPGHPVVIELKGIEESRIAREDGNPDCWPHIELFCKLADRPDMVIPGAFRLAGVNPGDITSIYDLKDWLAFDFSDIFYQPDAAAIERAKHSPSDWLHRSNRQGT